MKKFYLPKVVLDANVLYPLALRNLLLSLAGASLYLPHWSSEINEEWTRNLLKKRSDLNAASIISVADKMNIFFPNAQIENYQHYISNLNLPDPDDRHVLAAAIKVKATIITTANLRDFPKEYIRQFDIDILHPDEFVTQLLVSEPDKCLAAFRAQVMRYENPPFSEEDYLQALEKCELKNCLIILRKLLKSK